MFFISILGGEVKIVKVFGRVEWRKRFVNVSVVK